jgi:hypothetical protein
MTAEGLAEIGYKVPPVVATHAKNARAPVGEENGINLSLLINDIIMGLSFEIFIFNSGHCPHDSNSMCIIMRWVSALNFKV